MVPITLEQLEQAWFHVEENAGCAGVDGVTTERFAHQAPTAIPALFHDLLDQSYKPLPLLEIRVAKKDPSSFRRLLLPSVRDRILQTAVTHALTPSLEHDFLDASYAYRPGRGADSAIARVTQLRDRNFSHVVHSDIETFFDAIPHSQLRSFLSTPPAADYLPLIDLWLSTPWWDGQQLHPLRAGIPQGSPLSPLLSNFFLESFDAALSQDDIHLVRYADDFLLLCNSPEAALAARQRAVDALALLDLHLNPEKTEIVTFSQGFHFLGAFFLDNHVYTPWKSSHHKPGRLLFIAPPMSSAQIAHYLHTHPGRPPKHAPKRRQGQQLPPAIQDHPMPYLYLTNQGAVVRKSGDRILVDLESQVILDLPYHKLEALLLFGNIQITSAAMAELLDHRISLSLFTRHGRFLGALSPPAAKNVELRVAHFEAFRDPDASFTLARSIVAAKIRNASATLNSLARRVPGPPPPAVADLQQAVAATTAATHIQALDGVEGAAARAYFDALMAFNKSAFPWPGRVKHPSPDPINALLSLTYSLLTTELMSLAAAAGLDPYLGFLHQLDYGRPSLALDLIEAFRHPVADRFVLSLLNQNIFQTEDFHRAPDGEGLFLRPDSLKTYFAQYEKWMLRTPSSRPSFRHILQVEVELLARHFRDHSPWSPFDAAPLFAQSADDPLTPEPPAPPPPAPAP